MTRSIKTMTSKDERALYADMLLRWLNTKVEYPWNNEPEPVPPTLTPRRYRKQRADIIADFRRFNDFLSA